jgi:hypothetical protein
VVLVVGDVADVVSTVLDSPVVPYESVEIRGAGQVGREVSEVERGLGGEEFVVEGRAFAGDPDDLSCVKEQAFGCGRGRGGTVVESPVTAAGGGVFRGKRTLRGEP